MNIDNEINYHLSIVGGRCIYGTLDYVIEMVRDGVANITQYVTNGYGTYAVLIK